jgi:hypothetical protein
MSKNTSRPSTKRALSAAGARNLFASYIAVILDESIGAQTTA